MKAILALAETAGNGHTCQGAHLQKDTITAVKPIVCFKMGIVQSQKRIQGSLDTSSETPFHWKMR